MDDDDETNNPEPRVTTAADEEDDPQDKVSPMALDWSLRDIQREIEVVTTSDKLDKESALTITRLFHAMESLLRHECNERDRLLADTKNTLELTRIKAELERFTARDELASQPPPTPHHLPAVGTKQPRRSRW